MPVSHDPNNAGHFNNVIGEIDRVNYKYKYPNKLKLKPGSDLHDKIVDKVIKMANDSHTEMSKKHREWREIDDTLRAYVRPERITTSNQDPGDDVELEKFERIVMPVSYANLETLLTYMTSAFLQDPIFKYEGVGPEDVLGAMLMEKKIALDCRRFKNGLALHTHWRDGFAYGFGAVSPLWERRMGYKTVVEEEGFLHRLGGMFVTTEKRKKREWVTMYEGNKLDNIDPYRFLPDPNVAVHEIQEAEYIGWSNRTSYMALLERERDEKEGFFNAKYVQHTSGKSQFIEAREQRERSDKSANVESNHPVDEIWMYVTIIPSEWKVGDSDNPEKWLFLIGADRVILFASPVGLDHNMYPVTVCAPDYDGYSITPTSRLSIVSDLQNLIDFLYSSHVMNVRKAINDTLVVDPAIINILDVQNPGAGKIIRMRRSMWGRGNIQQAIQQLPITDITRGHVDDVAFLQNFVNQLTGASDVAQGNLTHTGPRISASQASGARTSVLGKLEKTARIIDLQSHQDIAYMMASHTQQLMEDDTYAKALGEWGQRLEEDYGIEPDRGRVKISPMDLIVDYDIVAHTGTVPGSEDPGMWVQVAQMFGQVPEAAASVDWPRMIKHIARQMGAKNVDDFIKKTTPQVVPDDEVAAQVQQGNLVPAGQTV